ncbi:conserved hypothetical protein [Bacteroides sp. 3_1_23]|jgi:hypothetical protein|uniref:hypothetical protein n=1 Tax=Bacteroides sp. 3_1_23 TaxID=457390 RepID=UPI0001DAA22F|nr:hypothetical protein [Bacteroides sp. 3_1_23]EFI40055.1 conserved hypothetical protein [Bacteroides sp. 3_1_23]DAL01287.1 MAG TPA: large terminase [Caudoviricetes sp.]
MTRKQKLKTSTDEVEQRYANWMAQLISIMMPWALYWIAGRASAKTVQVLSERVQEVAQDCQGAPFAWVADTYSDLHKNVIPSLIDGLSLLGWEIGIHYVINQEPPKEWQERMYNVCTDWRNTMVFYTGFNFTFISLDRPSIGAGRSYVGVFGDEVKYFPEEKFTNLLKAVRGFRVKYGMNVWYRSRTLTTDMPNPNHIGEYDWILKLAKQNDKDKILLMLQAGFVYNETKKTYVATLQEYNEVLKKYRFDKSLAPSLNKLQRALELAGRNMKRWEERWIKTRSRTSFFFISSSYVNADVLGLDWFSDEFSEGLEGILCNILSIIPKLEAGQMFYCNLAIRHFYADGFINEIIETKPLGWKEDCTVLRHLDMNRPLEAGMDSGNMLSMVLGQQDKKKYKVLKELYTLPPNTARELADNFLEYFKPHRRKILKLYYDRSMNNYHKVKADMATQIKKNIEFYADGTRTGWQVQLMSLGQGNIGSNLEYRFFMDLLSGNLERGLFTIQFDQYNCSNLKSEMEITGTKSVTRSDGGSEIVKLKTGDKLPTNRLPKESTNLTDALKYLMLRKEWIRIWKTGRNLSVASRM